MESHSGCDLPLLTSEWLAYLIDRALVFAADAIVPQSAAGAESLCAMYRKGCEANIAKAIARGVRKVTGWIAELNVERIELMNGRRLTRADCFSGI